MKQSLFCCLNLLILLSLPHPARALENFYARHNELHAESYYLLSIHEPILPLLPELALVEPPTKDVRFVVNLPPRQLTIYENKKPTQKYPVTIGRRRYKTPIGPRSLSKLIWNPWWYPPKSDWAKDSEDTPPGPGNPLGKVKIPLGGPILLHGTSKPWSIGRAASHACMRMHNRDIIEIAKWLQVEFSNYATHPLALKHQQFWYRRSYEVPLTRTIPLEIVYQTVEVDGDEIILHPDVYKQNSDYSDDLVVALARIGIPGIDIDFESLPSTLPTQGSVRIPIQDILHDSKLF